MKAYDTIVWHYTATYDDQYVDRAVIDAMHKARGWSGIGYHFVLLMDGTVQIGRPITQLGSHVKGQNSGKIGCVAVGGLRRETGPERGVDTRTPAQKIAQRELTERLIREFPTVKRVCGHRDLAATQCPGYDVASWWKGTAEPTFVRKVPTVSFDMVKQGSRGTVVETVQRLLQHHHFYAGLPIDGNFGPLTKKAVMSFQASRIIDVDGEVGPMTWVELLKE
jgi:N-acetylmuramoyl-L-alanine amidase